MATKGTILTGHRTTGPRHLGHLVGTLQKWAELQDAYTCYFLLADLHTLTTDYSHADQKRANVLDVAIDWMAAGIDPQKATIVLQSALPQHPMLTLLFSMMVTVARLERVPTYKEQASELHLTPSAGLLTYPVLQAADILAFKADTVPVGEDQLPHLELAREIARRFNQLYGDFFPEPYALLSEAPRLPGTDNRTMHSSYGNTILLKDTPEETTRKVMGMYTDPTRLRATDPGHVEGNPVFTYLDLFDRNREEVTDLKTRYTEGKIGDVSVKHHLAEVLNDYLRPIRERRSELADHPDQVIAAIQEGTMRARPIVQETLEQTMQRMGLSLATQLWREAASRNEPIVVTGAFC